MKTLLETIEYKEFNEELAEKVIKKIKSYRTTVGLDKVIDFEAREGKGLNILIIFERSKTKSEIQKDKIKQEKEALNLLFALSGRRLI